MKTNTKLLVNLLHPGSDIVLTVADKTPEELKEKKVELENALQVNKMFSL